MMRYIFIVFIFFFEFSGRLLAQEDTVTMLDTPLSFPITISYQNNSAEISHVSRLRLSILADYLNENPSAKVVIEGHVCCGPAKRMSKKRARSVYKYLHRIGAPKAQMTYVGKSFDEPIIPREKNEFDKDRNRRVEIELVTVPLK
jgi:outer membrane protein OmpA-like peptidoglycan-associated protein